MSEVCLVDLVVRDIFIEIQKFLSIMDLFALRCTSREFRDYIDSEFVKLKTLRIVRSNPKTENSFKVLSEKCRKLETINLSYNQWLTDELLLPMLRNNATTITSLTLIKSTGLTAIVLQPVIINSPKLRKLRLQNCDWLTVGCVEAIAFHQSKFLEELDVTGCSMMSEKSINLLLTKFQKLRTLSLANILSVNDNVLFTISKYLTDIVHLNLMKCLHITDRGIGALSLNCTKLESLSIRGCIRLTERSLALLRSKNVTLDKPTSTQNV